jgi:ribosomal protein S18 acetylase RimI-like enzyme
MSDVIIRPMVQQDLPYLYEICLKTGNSGKDGTAYFNDPYMIGQYWAAPYYFFEDGIAFCAELEGFPVGYILGVPDTDAFNAWFNAVWLPPLRARYEQLKREMTKTSREWGCRNAFLQEREHELPHLAAEYPAHLHIDILDKAQGRGVGRHLMKALLDELRTKNTRGIHLGANNEGAVIFYQKMGFKRVEEGSNMMVLGLH